MIEIRNHRIYVGGRAVAYRETPNKGGALRPEGIILHDTAGGLKADGSIEWLCKPAAKASAHVVVARDGTITQLAPLNVRTWHAGPSSWKGRRYCNGFTIGIEIVNPGKLTKTAGGYVNGLKVKIGGAEAVEKASTAAHGSGYWLTYTDEQIATVQGLCRAICETYRATFIGAHWEISPKRKIDTNPLFPLEATRAFALRSAAPAMGIIGELPPVEDMSAGAGDDAVPDAPDAIDPPQVDRGDPTILSVQKRLRDLGYFEIGEPDGGLGGMARTEGAILAFRNDNDLPISPAIDDELLATLAKASPRKVSEARSTATVADLREKGSTTITLTDRIKKAAGWLLGTAAVGGGASGGDIVDGVTGGATKLGGLKSALGSLGIGVGAILLLAAVGVLIWYLADRAQKNRVVEYRKGKNT